MNLPFFYKPELFIFFFFILCRLSGLFLISPVLSNKMINSFVRMGLSMFLALIVGGVLYPRYFEGPQPFITQDSFSLVWIGALGGAEIFVGYVMGLVMHFLFEMLIIAGQQVGMLVGFSMAEMLDPVSGQSQGLISQVYGIGGTLIFLILDLHHGLLELLVKSFDLLPLGGVALPQEGTQAMIVAGTRMFEYVVQLAAIPYVVLMLTTLGLGLMTRIMPEMNIFMVGFPVKLLLGFWVTMASLSVFKEVIQRFYIEMINIVTHLLPQMVPPV